MCKSYYNHASRHECEVYATVTCDEKIVPYYEYEDEYCPEEYWKREGTIHRIEDHAEVAFPVPMNYYILWELPCAVTTT